MEWHPWPRAHLRRAFARLSPHIKSHWRKPRQTLEDATQQTIDLIGISAGAGDSQPLAVTATSSDPAIVPDPTVTYTTPNALGTLQYTPVPNTSGSVIITVTVTDGGLDNDLGTADTTIQNFEDVGIHVGNVSGTLTIDVTNVLINTTAIPTVKKASTLRPTARPTSR